jgi:predicted transcriptional regulator
LDILTLHRRGLKQRAIARKLGISRNTVKKYINKPAVSSMRTRTISKPGSKKIATIVPAGYTIGSATWALPAAMRS